MKGAICRKIASFIIYIGFLAGYLTADTYSLYLRYQLKKPADNNSESTVIRKQDVPLSIGEVATIGNESRLEFVGPGGELLRIGHNSEFSPVGKNRLEFAKGSFLLFVHKGGPRYSFLVNGVEVRIAGHGTFLGEVMPLGGLKLISVSGEGHLISLPRGVSEEFHPGHIHFFLKNGERPPNIEIDMVLLVNSCPLITLFKDELPSMREIKTNARRQAANIKYRSNSFVYDAVGKDRIRFFVPDGTKKDTVFPSWSNPLRLIFTKLGF